VTFFSGCVVKVPEVMEKLVEKIREMRGLNYVPVKESTFGIKTDIELDEKQFNELTHMLSSEGFEFLNMTVVDDGEFMEIYRNKNTHETVAIDYIKGEKYVVGNIIHYWKE